MNHRRALRASTDAGLSIFVVMAVGVILWTADEVLNWNILPDWIDAFAQLLVIIMSILAAFTVIISVMCSFAVMAESAAERAGIQSPPSSGRAKVLVVLCTILALTIMAGFNKIDDYRQRKIKAEQREQHQQRYYKNQGLLQERIPDIAARLSGMREYLNETGTPETDEALARLINAVHSSTPLDPKVSIMIPAKAPYKYCIITALQESRLTGDNKQVFVHREFLIDLPTIWERDTVAALFKGKDLTVPHSRSGAFINTNQPSSWGFVKDDANVVAVIMLRAAQN